MPRSPPQIPRRSRPMAWPISVITITRKEIRMSKRRSTSPRPWLRRLHALWSAVRARLLVIWRALRSRRPPARVEVLATDRIERRRLEREIRSALRRLARVSSPTLSCQTGVLVQRIVQSNPPRRVRAREPTVRGSALHPHSTRHPRWRTRTRFGRDPRHAGRALDRSCGRTGHHARGPRSSRTGYRTNRPATTRYAAVRSPGHAHQRSRVTPP